MSLKKIEQVKGSKWFKISDLIIYAVIIIAVVALIVAFAVKKDKTALGGFTISCNGTQLYEYSFEDGKGSITEGYEESVEKIKESSDGSFTLRVYYEGGSGYNDVFVNVKKKTVKVKESNCSSHKDCVYTPELDCNGSTPIICTPHALVIAPLKLEDSGTIKT